MPTRAMGITDYYDTVEANLPSDLGVALRSFPAELIPTVDSIFRLLLGDSCPTSAPETLRESWSKAQQEISHAVEQLKSGDRSPTTSSKRSRDDAAEDAPTTKRVKTSEGASEEDDPPLFTLNALSLTSPIRKKADITVHRHTLRLTNPTTHAAEHPPIPLTALHRAFLLPTRGKTKAHWTVLLMPADTPTPGKTAAGEAPQVAFGLDATPPGLTTTSHSDTDGATATAHPKGSLALPFLRTFLAHLPIPTLEPSTAVFRSAAAAGEPVAGVQAYKGAKNGTLWFLDEGVLWDGRPAEFWPLAELAPGDEGAEGVRMISATGRTCSVFLRRLLKQKEKEGEESDEEGAKEQESVDVDFGMVDGKEQDGISRWVKAHRCSFGKHDKPEVSANGKGKEKEKAVAVPVDDDDDDSEDENFSLGSEESDGGSATSDSGSEDGTGPGGDDKSEDLESESDASDEDAEDAEGEEELDPAHHPLLRPGAMPKHISRAALDAVVGMVEKDMMGIGKSSTSANAQESESEEEDELED